MPSPLAWMGSRVFGRLERAGVLGMNRRNAAYILERNPRRLYPLVDDKVRTKTLATRHGIAVPELYAVVEASFEIGGLHAALLERDGFVIKPAQGSGGAGILVVAGHRGIRYRRANGLLLEPEELEYHVANVLSGMYSLGGHPDRALIEYRVHFDRRFENLTYLGVPDIRTVVYRGVPVMAMLRLPTRRSDGRANLHQGAVGVGVDLASGRTRGGVCLDRPVDEHPDTAHPVAGLELPGWTDLLELAARCWELTGLGYLGVDVVLDETLGPLMLEMNARPGISIQIANRAGLVPRLQAVDAAWAARRESGSREPHPGETPQDAGWKPEERVAYAQLHFGAKGPGSPS